MSTFWCNIFQFGDRAVFGVYRTWFFVLNIDKHFLAFVIFIVGLKLVVLDDIQNVNKKNDLSFVVCVHNKEFWDLYLADISTADTHIY